jgi:hypothetical protein
VLMKQAGLPFEERKLRFDDIEAASPFKQAVLKINPRAACRCWSTTASRSGTRSPSRSTWRRSSRPRAVAARPAGAGPGAQRVRRDAFGLHRPAQPLRHEHRGLAGRGRPAGLARAGGGAHRRRAHRADVDRLLAQPAGPCCSASSASPTPSTRRCACACAPTRCRSGAGPGLRGARVRPARGQGLDRGRAGGTRLRALRRAVPQAPASAPSPAKLPHANLPRGGAVRDALLGLR